MLTVFGLVQMLFGYRLYRLWATFQGIAWGAISAVSLMEAYLPDYSLLQYLAGLVGAALGGALFFYVSVFLYGAALGFAITLAAHIGWMWLELRDGGPPSFAALTQFFWIWFVYAGTIIAAGVLAVVFRRQFLIVLTSLGGAATAVLGAACAAGHPAHLPQGNQTFLLVTTGIAFLILSIVAIVVQWRTSDVPLDIFVDGGSKGGKGKSKPKKPAADDEE